MKTFVILLGMLCNFTILNPAFAQNDEDLAPIASAANVIFRRIHTVGFDTYFSQMKPGDEKKSILVAFNVEGAIIFQKELEKGEVISRTTDWNTLDRDAGVVVLPFQLQLTTQGQKHVTFAALSFRKMNEMSEHSRTENPMNEWTQQLWKIVDRIDVLNFTWDHKMNFSNLSSFDFELAKISLRSSLSRNANQKNGFALKLYGGLGWGGQYIDGSPARTESTFTPMTGVWGNGHPKIVTIERWSTFDYKTTDENMDTSVQYGGGFDYQVKTKNGSKFKLESTLNRKYKKTHYTQEYYYREHPGNTINSSNSVLAEPHRNKGDIFNRSLYFTNAAEYSVRLNSKTKTPVNLGIGIIVNVPLYDRIVSESENSDLHIDLDQRKYNNQLLTGKMFINF